MRRRKQRTRCCGTFCASQEVSARVKYAAIYRHREGYPAAVMCKFFEASRSGCRYICVYDHERIQTKTGVTPLTLRHSA